MLGFRKCLAYFVRQPQRNFFLWNFIYCLRSVEFVEFELDFVLHELSQQQNVSFFFLILKYMTYCCASIKVIGLLYYYYFFPLSTLFLVAVLLFAEGVNFCQKQHVLNEMWCICAGYRPECLEIALRVIGFGGIIYRRANKICG